MKTLMMWKKLNQENYLNPLTHWITLSVLSLQLSSTPFYHDTDCYPWNSRPTVDSDAFKIIDHHEFIEDLDQLEAQKPDHDHELPCEVNLDHDQGDTMSIVEDGTETSESNGFFVNKEVIECQVCLRYVLLISYS